MRDTWDESEVAYRRWSVRGFFRGLPPLSRGILFATVGLFLVQWILRDLVLSEAGYEEFADIFALTPARVLSRKLWLWQLVTYMFLHSLRNLLHIILNMFVFAMFAPEVERAMGPKRFAVLYFGAGVFAGLLSCVAMYSTFEANRQIIGASGAVMGVLAGYGRLFPNRVVNLFLVFPMKAKHCVWLLAGMEMLAVFMGNDSGIASVAHLGGFAAGFLFIRYEWTLHSALLRSIERHYDRERETDRQIRERVDQLLGKVNREGIDNLTWRERAFLKRASKRFKRQNR